MYVIIIIVMYIASPVIKSCSILQVLLKTFKIELQGKIVVKHTNNYLHPFVLLLIFFYLLLYTLTPSDGVQLLELNTVM